MISRIKTSSITNENLTKIQNKYHFPSRASILRVCISLSLNSDENPLDYMNGYENRYGFDISLQTLFGEDESYFKSMIKYNSKKNLTDEEFINYIVAHIEHGMTILYGEFATTSSLKELITRLI